ncbi:MAG TPA: type II toxin-antitoxin system VapC family toxin [Candidatus Acidoferrum sp.]
MKAILLDTHSLLWWLDNDDRLSRRAREAIQNPITQVLVSVGSLWEIAIKQQLGKLKASNLVNNFQKELDDAGFVELPISGVHAIRAAVLPINHRDPFDRLLIAQAEIENVPIVSRDSQFDAYGVHRVW